LLWEEANIREKKIGNLEMWLIYEAEMLIWGFSNSQLSARAAFSVLKGLFWL